MKFYGKGGISAEIVKHSSNVWGDEIVTYKLRYPRIVHSEFMTHRMLSKNAASSRAIPVNKQIEQIRENPAMPVHWGLNQPGMQAKKEKADVNDINWAKNLWKELAQTSSDVCKELWDNGKGFHKQVVNRLNEPFQFMDVIVSATDWDNFFWLRCHEAADPTIKELANVMFEALEASKSIQLRLDEWHLPFIENMRDENGTMVYYSDSGDELTIDLAQQISASCCAQVSYRKLDTSVDKALDVYDRLINSDRLHASPFEHQATPFSKNEQMVRLKIKRLYCDNMKVSGLENLDSFHDKCSDQFLYSGNFKGWHQYRKYFDNENYKR